MKILTGTSGFAHQEWKGTFYPEKISPKDLLRFYAGRLGTVEINNTFYHMPRESVLKSWAGQVPDDFVFGLKAPQIITHIKRLRNVFEETEYLFKSLTGLDNKRGPVLFQFPKSFRVDRSVLENFVPLIPADAVCAFDFRSPTWLDDGIVNLLREKGLGWCIEDTDENPVQELISTASWGYLRLRRSEYTDADLARWLEMISSTKWDTAFVYFKHEEGPEMALRFQELAAAELYGKKVKTGGKAG
jgi:uncharacterized protein YecE (DUF72 family)